MAREGEVTTRAEEARATREDTVATGAGDVPSPGWALLSQLREEARGKDRMRRPTHRQGATERKKRMRRRREPRPAKDPARVPGEEGQEPEEEEEQVG